MFTPPNSTNCLCMQLYSNKCSKSIYNNSLQKGAGVCGNRRTPSPELECSIPLNNYNCKI